MNCGSRSLKWSREWKALFSESGLLAAAEKPVEILQ
jgi:hypothetical protein